MCAPVAAARCATWLIFLLIAGGWATTCADAKDTADSGTTGDGRRVLHVHLVPHTHDDVGWLKTPLQYFYGWNNTIQNAAVRYILDTAIAALTQNPNRTFTYVEMAYFSMWWSEQSEATKSTVKDLVAREQLSFANGGWCMHDEAATHYMGMIDQTTLGHSFLKRELGVVPTVGWQLDPFGHSATQASLLTAKLGFDALYFGRIDYQDRERRLKTQQCEGLWSSSPNLDDSTVFWGLTGSYDGNYGPPPGFCFDVHCGDDYLIGQDESVLKARISGLLQFIKVQSDRTKGDHIMLTMGEDFNYENAFIYYSNMDFLIELISRYQSDGTIDIPGIVAPRFDEIEIFYSTPEKYTRCKHEELWSSSQNHEAEKPGEVTDVEVTTTTALSTSSWETKTDDFFPYSDCENCFWTGYFTSRPALKRLERVGSSFLLAARQLESFSESAQACHSPLRPLDEAMGVAQHHDAVSGTSKQHVAYDYAKRIQSGINDAAAFAIQVLRDTLVDDSSVGAWDNLMFCQLRNETICKVTQEATKSLGSNVYVVVYNALAQAREDVITVPVACDAKYSVDMLSEVYVDEGTLEANQWEPVESVLIPTANFTKAENSADFVLHFQSKSLLPVGASIFRIRMDSIGMGKSALTPTRPFTDSDKSPVESLDAMTQKRGLRMEKKDLGSDFVLSNGLIEVHFERGVASRVCDRDGICSSVHQEWGFYTSYEHRSGHGMSDSIGQNSGAYIFRPSIPDQKLQTISIDPSKTFVYQSDLVTEVHIEYKGGWIKQITRIKSGEAHVEVEFMVGPIPIDDGIGKEVVTRFNSDIQNDGAFYTDSNGREFMKRKRSFRPTWDLHEFQPVSGNYYPVNAAIFIEDQITSMSVLVDRSQGGASLADGSIELMVHRRTVADDARGVGEPLNETSGMAHYPPFGDAKRLGKGLVVSGIHRLMISSKGHSGASLARSYMDKAFSEPLVFAASSSSSTEISFKSADFSVLSQSLPENAMLITLQKITSSPKRSVFLVRLGHQYGTGEHANLANAVDVDLSKLLPRHIVSVVEKTLSGNQDAADWEQRRLRWDELHLKVAPRTVQSAAQNMVRLKPMEIRTFEVTVDFDI